MASSQFVAPREERLTLTKLLKEERELLIELISEKQSTEHDLERFVEVDSKIEQLERINRAEVDLLYFAIEYCSVEGNPKNDENLIPKNVTYENSANFHKELCQLLDNINTRKETTNVAWACPRGHAKTAYLSQINVLHEVVFKSRRYIVVISNTNDVASQFIDWSRNQLKTNEKLRNDFGELLEIRAAKNEKDNQMEYITKNGVKVEARGAGGQMRGLRHGDTRPDMLVLDDLEDESSTNTPEQIAKMENWFNSALLPNLSNDGGICVYLGTILCYDSLLDKVIKNRKDFKCRKYSAIKSFALNEALWNEWRQLYRKDDPNAADNAKAFFNEHKDEMLEGTSVLWEQYFDYYQFMVKLESIGIKSFNQEYQNEPTDEERQVFKPEQMHYYLQSDLVGKRFEYYAGVDFAMGKEKGDYSVILTLARNKDTGVCYVVDVWAERVHPDRFLEVIVEKCLQYEYDAIAVEAQMAQEYFADTLRREMKKRGFPADTRLKLIKQRTRKALRIESLLPDIVGAKILFSHEHTLLLNQLAMYPMSAHDDCPDALHMAYSTASKGFGGIVRTFYKATRW